MALEVLFVGVSSAAPGGGEETACYLINGSILIDAGWNAAVNMQVHGAQPTDVDCVIFTHCHQDHTLGLPGLFFANRRRLEMRPEAGPLKLYGPMDLGVVRDGACVLLQAERYPQCVPAHEVEWVYPGDELEIAGLEIAVGRAFHPLDARCYRVSDPATGASVVFSGDTFYHQGLPLFAKDCDVLVHEAAAAPDAEIPDVMRHLHSRPQDAALVAQESGASSLVLVHCGPGQGSIALAAAKRVFPNVRLGKKGEKAQIFGPGQVAWV
ncbi:MAG: MBL fold metallo-hydrolase [Candidatus Latescibacterota bacterium]|nr:MBL fold metallo-hydrolase [Candidatus Latescibacterota bacterium]